MYAIESGPEDGVSPLRLCASVDSGDRIGLGLSSFESPESSRRRLADVGLDGADSGSCDARFRLVGGDREPRTGVLLRPPIRARRVCAMLAGVLTDESRSVLGKLGGVAGC